MESYPKNLIKEAKRDVSNQIEYFFDQIMNLLGNKENLTPLLKCIHNSDKKIDKEEDEVMKKHRPSILGEGDFTWEDIEKQHSEKLNQNITIDFYDIYKTLDRDLPPLINEIKMYINKIIILFQLK